MRQGTFNPLPTVENSEKNADSALSSAWVGHAAGPRRTSANPFRAFPNPTALSASVRRVVLVGARLVAAHAGIVAGRRMRRLGWAAGPNEAEQQQRKQMAHAPSLPQERAQWL